ncbi:hypothetical protein [Prauserella endophytica]|uniref:Uncharacterized protein n=1 Tax=Prauserella endophytica TaxID=1592324 RepID=A0ABY2RS24_9PSEU|nr:hypothetical protein [Prauserella endophytica]TKG57751.1 hypothetical protein FCN18_38740 [Prauserella endophytica]
MTQPHKPRFDRDQFDKLYRDHTIKVGTIADRLGIHRNTVHIYADVLGIPRRTSRARQRNSDEPALASAWFNRSYLKCTTEELSTKLGFTSNRIFYYANNHGFPRRGLLATSNRDRIEALWLDHELGITEIAERLGTTPKGVLCLVGWHGLRP